MFKSEYTNKILEISGKLGVPYEWLYGLIKYESNFDPQIKNPGSSARGLIQVMDKTARDLFNVADSLTLIIRYPDFDRQMDNVVYPYLEPMMPFPTKQSLYMAVFFPIARNVPPSTSFYEIYRTHQTLFGNNWEGKYFEFAAVNRGIKTVQDYIDKVDGVIRAGGITLPDPKRHPVATVGIIAAGVIIWKLTRR